MSSVPIDALRAWRDRALAREAVSVLWQMTRAYYMVLLPCVLSVVAPAYVFVPATFGGALLYVRKRLRDDAWRREAVAAAGGEEAFQNVRRLWATWSSTAVQVGLSLPKHTGKKGIIRTYFDRLNRYGEILEAEAREETEVGYIAPRLLGVQVTRLGYEHVVELLPSQTSADFRRRAEALAEIWRVREVRVERGTPGTVRVTAVTTDPLERPTQLDLNSIGSADSLGAVPVGVTESGDTWAFPLSRASHVIGGVPGSGKSQLLGAIVMGCAARDDVQFIGIDMKGGVELRTLAPRLAALATDHNAALATLERLVELQEARWALLRSEGRSSFEQRGFDAEDPLYVLLVDEAAELFAPESVDAESKAVSRAVAAAVSRLIRLGRAAGIVVVLATQRPTVDAIPSAIRDQAQSRTCFRVVTHDAAVATLGEYVRGEGVISPTRIAANEKGVAVFADGDGSLTRVRGFYVSDEVRLAHSQRYSHLARSL